MVLTTIIGYFYIGKDYSNYICARAIGILTSIIFITAFFYTYTGIIGTNYAILDISSFFIAVFLGEFVSFKKVFFMSYCNNYISIGIISILLLSFILFTYFPPKINYFKDPITNSYGILK